MVVILSQSSSPSIFSVLIINMKKNFQKQNKGAVLLIAVLMASVMLSVGLGVYQRTYKQLVFASFWKQMQVAFAAADGGLECALYWDLHPATPSCFGLTSSSWTSYAWDPATFLSGIATFSANTSAGCVKVTIAKPSPDISPYTLPAGTPYSTKIDSRGYNVSCAVVNAGTNPRVVERGLSINY